MPGSRAAAWSHAEVTTRGLHASVQAIYADFHDRRFIPVFGANVRSTLFTLEALAGPVVAAGPVKLSPMAGIRHTRIRGMFDAPGLGRLKAGNDWQEVLVGSYRLSRTVALAAGYRWTSEKVLSRRPGELGMNLDGEGPLLGVLIGL